MSQKTKRHHQGTAFRVSRSLVVRLVTVTATVAALVYVVRDAFALYDCGNGCACTRGECSYFQGNNTSVVIEWEDTVCDRLLNHQTTNFWAPYSQMLLKMRAKVVPYYWCPCAGYPPDLQEGDFYSLDTEEWGGPFPQYTQCPLYPP